MATDNYRLFCTKIPSDVSEQELLQLFRKFDNLHELTLMTNSGKKQNRGFAFVTFETIESRNIALQTINGYEIRKNQFLKVTEYSPNRRLYLGNIAKSKDIDQLRDEFNSLFAGVDDVIVYRTTENRQHSNRGFCFVQFKSHDAAREAKRSIEKNSERLFGHSVYVDWADPIDEPDDSVMDAVRVLYVRNLMPTVNEERLKELFESFGRIERVKKMKNFAFVHFVNRKDAINAMETLNRKEIDGETIDVTLSRPPTDKRRKEEILRAREQRMRAQAAI